MIDLSEFVPLESGVRDHGAVVALPAYNVCLSACGHFLSIPSLEKLRAGVRVNKCDGCSGCWRPIDLHCPMPLLSFEHAAACAVVAAFEAEVRGMGGDPSRVTYEVVPVGTPRRSE